MQVINLTPLMSIMYIFFLLWLGDFLGSKLTPPPMTEMTNSPLSGVGGRWRIYR
jgi:hypothetical protein